MKNFNKKVIALSMAAAMSASASTVWAVDETPGSTTTSEIHSLYIYFDSTCYRDVLNQGSAFDSSGWYDSFVQAQAFSDGGAQVWNELHTRMEADVKFDITKFGLNGATNEINLNASITNASYALVAAGAGASGFSSSEIGDYWTGPSAIAEAGSMGVGSSFNVSQAGQSVSNVTRVKGANITEFNTSLTFNASSFETFDLVSVAQAYNRAVEEAGWGEGYAFTDSFSMAMASALSSSIVNLEINAYYVRDSNLMSGDQIIIGDVKGHVSCGGSVGVYPFAFAETNSGDGGGGVVILP